MTEIGIPPISENDETPPGSASSRSMLVTMLLLIAGLVLSSAMMLHYVMEGGGGIKENPLFGFRFDFGASDTAAGNDDGSRAASLSGEPTESASPGTAVSRLFSGREEGSVKWPRLRLTGFGRSTDVEGSFAIINGEQVLVNNYIGEVKLVEIRAHGAVVEYHGERRILTVDQTR